jgi:twitching motility two-component system response regulator PilH
VHATNIADAISIVQAIRVDAVSVDLAFPEGSGFDLIQFLKSGTRTHSIPIIVVSVKDSSEMITAAVLAGANLFVAKPVDLTQIKNAMSMVLQLPDGVQPSPDQNEIRQNALGRWIL